MAASKTLPTTSTSKSTASKPTGSTETKDSNRFAFDSGGRPQEGIAWHVGVGWQKPPPYGVTLLLTPVFLNRRQDFPKLPANPFARFSRRLTCIGWCIFPDL